MVCHVAFCFCFFVFAFLDAVKMRDMRHDNVCQFVGACVDPPHICILMTYCAKGSLLVSCSV